MVIDQALICDRPSYTRCAVWSGSKQAYPVRTGHFVFDLPPKVSENSRRGFPALDESVKLGFIRARLALLHCTRYHDVLAWRAPLSCVSEIGFGLSTCVRWARRAVEIPASEEAEGD